MATTTFNYVAPSPQALIADVAFSGGALNYFNPLQNVFNKTELTTFVGKATLQKNVCGFNPLSSVAITPKALEVEAMSYQDRLCLADAKKLPQFNPSTMGNQELSDIMIAKTLGDMKSDLEARVFISSTADSVTTTGLYTTAVASGSGCVVHTLSGSVTATTAVADYNSFYAVSVPEQIQGEEHITFMSLGDRNALAQANLTTNGGQKIIDINAAGEYFYTVNPLNKIVGVKGLASGQWFASSRSNLWAGVGVLDDGIKAGITNFLDAELGVRIDSYWGVAYAIPALVAVRKGA